MWRGVSPLLFGMFASYPFDSKICRLTWSPTFTAFEMNELPSSSVTIDMSRCVPFFLITVSSFLWSLKEIQDSKNSDISFTSAAWLHTWGFLVDSFHFNRSFYWELYFITGYLSIRSIILAAVAFLDKIWPFFFFSWSSSSSSSLFSKKLSILLCSEFKLES